MAIGTSSDRTNKEDYQFSIFATLGENYNYEVHDDTVFLKQHELIVIPNKTLGPTHRLIRSHSYTRKLATYKQIKEYVLTKYNFNVSSEYIAIIKRKHGIDMQAVRLKEDAKHNNPPQEKIEAIEDALKYFKII